MSESSNEINLFEERHVRAVWLNLLRKGGFIC